MGSVQTKDQWIEEQQGSLLCASILISMVPMGLCGLFSFGMGCIFLGFLQAFGCGLTASVLAFLLSWAIVVRAIKRQLYEKAETMQFASEQKDRAVGDSA